jgi:chromosome segregation ATPase
MPDTRRPSPLSRDARIDSTPPPAIAEAPLGRLLARPSLAPDGRVASLEAEVQRLRSERANDADETAGMLVHIAESERMRAAAYSEAVEAGERAGTLRAHLESARRRIDELELELGGMRTKWALSEAQLSSARETMTSALGMLEEMERREEMAASMRARGLREALRALARDARDEDRPTPDAGFPSGETSASSQGQASSAPESSVEIVGVHEEWELDLAE